MKCNVTALAVASGILWGAAMLIVAAANLKSPTYGRVFLDFAASIYPGYHPSTGFGSVITGTLYGLVDGAVAGAIFGFIYNLFARHP